MRPTKRRTPFTEINITPLTDIFLVLLVIIMVTTPTLSQSNESITAPKFSFGDDIDAHKMIVEMDYTGATFVDGQPKSQAEIDALLADWLATAIDKTLVVRADALCESRLVLDLMRRAQTAGFEHFFIAGEARKPE